MTRRQGMVCSLVLVVASHLVVLARVVYNRTSPATSELVLGTRELAVSWTRPDDSRHQLGLTFQGRWPDDNQVAIEPPPAGRWARDPERLRNLGFTIDPALAPTVSPEERPGPRQRVGYVALSFGGTAFADWSRHQAAERARHAVATAHLAPQLASAVPTDAEPPAEPPPEDDWTRRHVSRLVAIDVDRDPTALRARHPDPEVLILPALFRLTWIAVLDPATNGVAPSPASYFPMVALDRLAVRRVWVPRGLREAVASLDDPLERRLRLRVGASYEPFLVAVEPAGASN